MWKRSWFRWTVRCVALLLLALLAVALYYRSRGANELAEARKEFEAKVGSLDPEAYEPKPVPDEDNGAVWLLAGAQAVVVFQPERAGLLSLAETPSSLWTKEQVQLATRLIERNAPALMLLRRSLGMKICNLEAVTSAGGRHLLPLVRAARLLAAASRDALRQGDMDRFFSSTETLRILSSTQEGGTELIEPLLGMASERLLLTVLQEAASAPALEANGIKRLDALVPAVDLMKTMRRSLAYETAAMAARLASGRREDDDGPKLGLSGRFREWTIGDLELDYVLHMRTMDFEWGCKPCAQRGVLSPPPPRPTLMPFKGLWSAAEAVRWDSRGSTFGRLQATLALREMTRLGLEVRKAGLERGAYPADLTSFSEANVPDPFTGKPVAYTLNTDGSSTLAVPDAEVLYKKVTAGKGRAIGFTWTLPPITAGKPSPSRNPAK